MKDELLKVDRIDKDAYIEDIEFFIKNGVLKQVKNLVCKQTLEIPDGVVRIEDGIFDVMDTMDLKKIVFPKSLKDIGKGNFECIDNLKKVVVNDNFVMKNKCLYSKDYKKMFFCLKNAKGKIRIKKNCETICSNAFSDAKKVTKIYLPKYLKSMGNFVFCGCKNLKEVVMPYKVDNIGVGLFFNCYKLRKVNLLV